jgi:hypothetical protein
MDVFEIVISNLNTWLVVLGVGVIVWAIRQVLPAKVESGYIWKTLLRIIPMVLGAGLALIPGLRPMEDNMMQSAVIGLIGGSFSQSLYDLLRQLVGTRLKAMMGSRAERLSVMPGPHNREDIGADDTIAVTRDIRHKGG